MLYAGTECIALQTFWNEVPYKLVLLYSTKLLSLRREASVRMQPAHNAHAIPTSHLILHFQAYARSAKTWRLGASIQLFFAFFVPKMHIFAVF